MLAPLIERSQTWMERLVAADDFDGLCEVLRDALDDFMASIFLQGYNRSNESVRRAVEFIDAHFAERVTLAAVARHVGLSPFRVAHLVKAVTGRSILQHVKRMRVQRARHLLETTDDPCADIALAVGFRDQSHLIRHFRALTGTTPARYRRERITA